MARARSILPCFVEGSIVLSENRNATKVAKKVCKQERRIELNINLASMIATKFLTGVLHFGMITFLQKTMSVIKRPMIITTSMIQTTFLNKVLFLSCSSSFSPTIGLIIVF